MPKVLITDPISDKGLDILIDAGIELIYGQNYNDDQIKNTLSTIDGWLIRSGTKITEDHLLLAKKLQVIGRAGVGTDNIDIKAATNMGVINEYAGWKYNFCGRAYYSINISFI